MLPSSMGSSCNIRLQITVRHAAARRNHRLLEAVHDAQRLVVSQAPSTVRQDGDVRVTTWTLEMLTPPPIPQPPATTVELAGARVELAVGVTPEYARFLYGLVGGPWRWTERLGWSREQWSAELAVVGSEVWVAYADGVPRGYVQLHPEHRDDGTEVEIRYFGLVEDAIGRGLGSALLRHGLDAAWTLSRRHDVPPVHRVWVHTCSLDGPAALANYRARGLVVCREEVTDEDVPVEPYGAWVSTTGAAVG